MLDLEYIREYMRPGVLVSFHGMGEARFTIGLILSIDVDNDNINVYMPSLPKCRSFGHSSMNEHRRNRLKYYTLLESHYSLLSKDYFILKGF